MDKKLDEIVVSLKDDMLKVASESIKFRSVEGKPQKGAPFGTEIKKVLEYMLDIGEKYKFSVKNVDGYGGHIEFGDKGKLFGVLGHLDVVPEGTGWDVDPYGGIIKDGYLWGRGAIDDKGPMVSALFALIAVKEAGIVPENRIRLIFGTDEESGWEGLKYYFKKEEVPWAAVTPDGEFPIIYAEKGIVNFRIWKERSPKKGIGNVKLISLSGGDAPNMIPSRAVLVLKVGDERTRETIEGFSPLGKARINTTSDGDTITVEGFGKSAHGSTPDEGINAIFPLLELLNNLELDDEDLSFYIKKLHEKLSYDTKGEALGIAGYDKTSGALTVNLGMLKITEEVIEAVINIRYPIFFDLSMIEKQIKEALSPLKVEQVGGHAPLYVSPDSELIKILKEVYTDVTGQEAYLIAIGGGTYARIVPNAVAFGPLFPGREELAHKPNERILIDDLIVIARIYAQLFKRVLEAQ